MIYDRLEDVMIEVGLADKDFAEKIGLKPQTIANIKTQTRKARKLHLKDVINISKVYNINLNWLLLGSGEMKNKTVEDSAIQNLIDYLAFESTTELGHEILIKATLENILKKLSKKNGLLRLENNRPVFLLMKILKNFNFEDKLDNKGYIENIIVKDIKEKKETKEKLLYLLKKSRDEEVDFLVKYKSTLPEILESKYDFWTKKIFMNRLIE